MTIMDWPAEERPREKLIDHGASILTDAELLAIFLRTGIPGKSAIDLARDTIQHFGGLQGLLRANLEQFSSLRGLGAAKFAQLQATLEMAKRCLNEELSSQDFLNSSTKTKQFLQTQLINEPREVFGIVYLNNQNQLIRYENLFYGTLDGASVYPREVLRKALERGASSVILAHNHPSGNPKPSQADIELTLALTEALSLVDIKVLDHLIVAKNRVISFAERGLIHGT